MSNWKEYSLSALISTNQRSVDKHYPFEVILYLDTGSITKGRIESLQTFKLQDSPSRAKRLVHKGDIIYSTVRPIQRHYGYIKDVPENLVVSTGFAVISTNQNLLSSKYLYYYLSSDDLVETLDMIADGSTSAYPSLKPSDIEELEILLPPIQEQQEIAEILSSLDDKIDLLHNQNQKLEELAEILFRQWFIVEADEDLELSDFMEINPSEKLSKGELAPYLEMKNVETDSSYPSDWYDREFSSGTKFRNGDTLLARITPCLENGKSAYVQFLESDEQVGWGSTEFLVFRTKLGFHPLCSYLLAKNEDFKAFAVSNMTGSSGRQRVQTDSLFSFSIGRPSDNKLSELNETFESTALKINANARQIKKLDKLRNTLLPKLMSGEVRVKIDDK